MLFHDRERERWFIVPDEVQISKGSYGIVSFEQKRSEVDESELAPFEVSAEEAKEWVDRRMDEGLSKASEVFGRFVHEVRELARSKGTELPEVPAMSTRARDLLGRSAGELYVDPTEGREALGEALTWAQERLGSTGEPRDAAAVLGSIGDRLKAAAAQIRTRREEAEARQRAAGATVAGGRAGTERLQRVGFFRELRHGDPEGDSLAAARRAEAQPHQADVVRYLRACPVLIASPGPVRDVLQDDGDFIGTPSVHTDGVWAWPGDLAAYVERYHLALPAPFLEHLIAQGFEPGEPDLQTLTFHSNHRLR